MEDLLAVLDRGHAAAGEAVAVAAAIDEVDDRRIEVAALQEVGVQRVRHLRASPRCVGRAQRLAEHLAAEHLRGADVAARAAEQVILEPLELEQPEQLGEPRVHQAAATPSRFCMAGLVVVYCRNCFLAGYR